MDFSKLDLYFYTYFISNTSGILPCRFVVSQVLEHKLKEFVVSMYIVNTEGEFLQLFCDHLNCVKITFTKGKLAKYLSFKITWSPQMCRNIVNILTGVTDPNSHDTGNTIPPIAQIINCSSGEESCPRNCHLIWVKICVKGGRIVSNRENKFRVTKSWKLRLLGKNLKY